MGTRTLGWSDKDEVLVPIKNDEAVGYLRKQRTVWVDVQTEHSSEIARVGRMFGVNEAILTDAAGSMQLPKLQTYDNAIFVILHGIYMENGNLKTTQVNCVVTDFLFLTIAHRAVPGLDWLWGAIGKPSVRRSSSPDELLGHLAEVIAHRYLAVINQFDDQIDDVYEEALTARRQVLTEVQRLRRETASISKVSRPQRVVLNDLISLDNPVIGDGRPLLRDAFDVQNMVVESLRSTRSMLADTLDTYRGATGDRQSTASTVLAVYSAVMLPLTFITGFFGMNVDLPGMHYKPAWLVIAVIMLTIAFGSIAVFLKVGFIRMPLKHSQRKRAPHRRPKIPTDDHTATKDAIRSHVTAYDNEDAANITRLDTPGVSHEVNPPLIESKPSTDAANASSSKKTASKKSAGKKAASKKSGSTKTVDKKTASKATGRSTRSARPKKTADTTPAKKSTKKTAGKTP